MTSLTVAALEVVELAETTAQRAAAIRAWVTAATGDLQVSLVLARELAEGKTAPVQVASAEKFLESIDAIERWWCEWIDERADRALAGEDILSRWSR